MKSKIFIIALFSMILITMVFIFAPRRWKANLVSPGFNPLGLAVQKSAPTPTSIPNIKAPKELKFDATTDLKAELEKVNPQVNDIDFE